MLGYENLEAVGTGHDNIRTISRDSAAAALYSYYLLHFRGTHQHAAPSITL